MDRGSKIYAICLVLLVSLAFFVGRSAVFPNHRTVAGSAALYTVVPPRAHPALDAVPLMGGPVRVEGFGQIGYPEIYELLEGSSSGQKEEWARQLAALREGSGQYLAAIQFYGAWIDLEPSTAIRSLCRFPNILCRANVLNCVIASVSPADLPELARNVSKLDANERHKILPAVLARWTDHDPAAAAEFLTSVSDDIPSSSLRVVFGAWADYDAESARAWLQKHDTFLNNTEVISGFVESWLKSDCNAAVGYVVAHSQSDSFSDAIATVSAQLYKISPDQARVFLLSLGAEQGNIAVGALWPNLDGPDSNAEVSKLANWFFALPRSLWEGHLGSLLQQWSAFPNSDVSRWINQFASADRDTLIAELMQGDAMQVTPDLARMVFSISDGDLRERVMRRLVPSLGGTPEEIEQEIRLLGLPKDQTDLLLKFNNETGGAQH